MDDLELELKRLIVTTLELEDIRAEAIDSEEALFRDGLGLDSIDGLELGMALRKNYGIKVEASKDELQEIFFSVRSIARYIERQRGAA
ncbi:MAG TPA: phosphopantetheine-binding protein [Stellaceae bacterium]|jgi:acyl carrier protein|nr:phosphopantetheine-binding protein [Stellaceae bacterium]